MDADDIVIEYIRGKLGKARGARAEGILKPAPAPEAEGEPELPPEELAELQALMQQEAAPEGPCPQCGAARGECDCSKVS